VATRTQPLAAALERLRALQVAGRVAIRSADLPRTARERLVRNGFLQEVMRGWYVPASPGEQPGDTTPWYAAYWPFVAAYLDVRLGPDWCVSADQSLLLHVGDRTVPPQLLVRSPRGNNKPTPLMHGTSVFDVRLELPPPEERVVLDGVRAMTLGAALVHASPGLYLDRAIDVRAALATLPDASALLRPLLAGGKSVVAGRLAGALRNIGRARIADDVLAAMRSAGYVVVESDPFEDAAPVPFASRERSPYVGRLRLQWARMRSRVLEHFPRPPGAPVPETYLQQVDDVYREDAYHSLSIEGYVVDDALIERARRGNWNPDHDERDRANRNALAARGYWQAFQRVRSSVVRVLAGENAGTIAEAAHGDWYRELFAPSVAAGLLNPEDLAGYRGGQVFIRRSMHVPPPADAVRDLMPEFFALLAAEPEPAVRVVLGHFFFVYVHPYMDGNGRMGRFLMNLMLASGGWPWTLVTVQTRDAYMAALEDASVRQDIVPFTRYLAERVAADAPSE
jgi:fido (protein-threonine AMPylation protein)